jgi:hypothetical protein
VAVLTLPQDRTVADACRDARRWCNGHLINGLPAVEHGARVALVLSEHLAVPPPELIAAALLHNAPEFGPRGDIDAVLTARHGPEAARIVRELHFEHHTIDDRPPPVEERLLLASTAHQVAELATVIDLARASGDPSAYLAGDRLGFHRYIARFRAAYAARLGRIPPSMAAHYADVLATISALAGAASTTAARRQRGGA